MICKMETTLISSLYALSDCHKQSFSQKRRSQNQFFVHPFYKYYEPDILACLDMHNVRLILCFINIYCSKQTC